ncbi:MAG: hypothetical protein ABI627_31700 [Polyangiaceae bacterium]
MAAGLAGISLASCSSDEKKKVMPFGEAGEGGDVSQPVAGGAGTPGPSGDGGSSAGGTANGGEGGAFGGAPGLGGAAGEPAAGAGGVVSVGGGATGGGGGAVATGGGGATGGTGCGIASTGSRITIAFDTAGNAEHVTNLQWLNNASAETPNLVAQGGPSHCTDPQEFFGQSYGAPEGTLPAPVVGGGLSTLAVCGLDNTITSAGASCDPGGPQIPVTTQYHFYSDAARASEMRITRTITFDSSTTVYANTVGLRPFVPRVPLATLPTVIYPNQAGTAITTTPATNCGGDCFTATDATWNGKWFADIDPTSGLALIVLRDPAMTAPVQLTINYDGYSNSNLASFVLVQPADGWTAPVTETEYVCFADLTSWPQTARDAATLPAGCGP